MRRIVLPRTLEPQLADLVKDPPVGDEWIHEIKYDGYRMLARISRGEARLISRHAKDWTRTFGTIARELARLPLTDAWLDGELVAIDERGRVSFQHLQNAVGSRVPAQLMYYAFDLIFIDGDDLREAPLSDRRARLQELLTTPPRGIRFSRAFEGSGQDFYEECCRMRLEGMLSKRRDSAYRSGRNRCWLKTKCELREDLIVVGFTREDGRRSGFESLVLGAHDQRGKLVYAGRVKFGFSPTTKDILSRGLARIVRKTSPLFDPPAARVHWVTPKVVAEIAFLERTRSGALRHAVFRGLCVGMDPATVRLPAVHDTEYLE
jgi:bifunctional non-homologous end joining protein LigD